LTSLPSFVKLPPNEYKIKRNPNPEKGKEAKWRPKRYLVVVLA
jgi:hypothetical protein